MDLLLHVLASLGPYSSNDGCLSWVGDWFVSDLLNWVVGVRGADVMEGGGQSRPQMMDFGLVLLRLDERYFALDFYPWSCDSIGGVTLGAGWAERLCRMLSACMLCARNFLCHEDPGWMDWHSCGGSLGVQ